MFDNQVREDIVSKVKEQADIVRIIGERVDLKKSGTRHLGLCPFHGEKTPSFSVHSGKQFFYCFGCGETGDVFSFMMKYYSLDFPSALKELAARYHIQLPEKPLSHQEKQRNTMRKRMYALNSKVAGIYREYLLNSSDAKLARNYLEKRQIALPIQDLFQIGYAPAVEHVGWNYLGSCLNKEEISIAVSLGLLVKKDSGGFYDRFRDRILFPIMDPAGKVIGFGGRIVGEGQPKYMNSPESDLFNKSKSLFGLFQNQDAIRKERSTILVEGNFDLVSLVNGGCKNVTAPLGTALTRGQLALIKRSVEEAVLLFDGDAAGIKAAIRAVPLFLAEELSGKVALLPVGHDPDTFIKEQGIDKLMALINEASPLPEFVYEQLVLEHGLTLDGKRQILQELKPLIQAAASPLQQSVVISHFAQKLQISQEDIKMVLERDQRPAPSRDQETINETGLRPLTPAQIHVVRFMVLNPSCFGKLEQAGVRECLDGTIGEVLFLQIGEMFREKEDLQPEELLTVLPEGIERSFVADLLVKAADQLATTEGNELTDKHKGELEELIEWIRCDLLKRQSKKLTMKIIEIQESGDFDTLQKLLAEKIATENAIQGTIG